MKIKEIIQISRPRFWVYTIGPYLVGYIGGSNEIFFWKNIYFFLFLFFFILPANIIIYGVNDLADEDTDNFNSKKGESSYEKKLRIDERSYLLKSILLSIFVGVLLSLGDPILLFSMILFFFLSIAYSAPPLRFKARPFIDAYSNFLYIVPAIIGYVLTTGILPDPIWLLIGTLWVAGMHTYSAIPDIEADQKANLNTTAVLLGHKGGLLFVFINWLFFASILITLIGPVMLVTLIYPLITLILMLKEYSKVMEYYRYFPFINGIIGFLAFWFIYFQKFSLEEVWKALQL